MLDPHSVTNVIFGIDPVVASCAVLAAVYAFIISERLNQAITALLGASAMIFLGVISQHEAVEGIDFNTIFLLIGMMIIVGIMKNSGVFQFVAILAAKSVKANPRALLAILSIITAVFSALLDNVTTVMLIVPITLLLTEQLKQNPYPFLFAQIFASNVGGTATLIGDPPNILIGSHVGFSFMDFVVNVGPPAFVIMIFLLIFFDFIWGRKMTTSLRARAHLLRYNAYEALVDIQLLYKSLFVLALVLFGFIVGHGHGYEPGSVALGGASLLMFLDVFKRKRGKLYLMSSNKQTHSVEHTFKEVEWDTIFFFMGLFIIVTGVESSGILGVMADKMLALTEGNMMATGMAILWISTVFSAFINNIPFVATIIPMIDAMAPTFGGADKLEPIWWALSLGACLGGNGSIVGASANVMVASYASRSGQPISFVKFMLMAFPLMIVTVLIASVYAYFVFF
jgi:Na+/H+ antiporter NhaD/arsenite permease-like protein